MQILTIVGHLGNDAEVKDLGTIQVINFSLAVTEKIKNENVTTWYKCAFFTNNVGIVPWLTKGSFIGVYGRPDLETYNANDGTTKSNLKCIVKEIKMYNSTKVRDSAAQQSTNAPREAFTAAGKTNAFKEEEHDDLPF